MADSYGSGEHGNPPVELDLPIDEFNRQVEWSQAQSLRRRQQKGKTMTHDIGPLASFVALAAVIGALAGSVLWGLLAGLVIIVLLYLVAELVD